MGCGIFELSCRICPLPCFHGILLNLINEQWLMQDLFSYLYFDPRQLPVVSKTLADFQSIPNILSAASDWQICPHLATKKVVWWRDHIFRHAVHDRLPKLAALAKAYIALLHYCWALLTSWEKILNTQNCTGVILLNLVEIQQLPLRILSVPFPSKSQSLWSVYATFQSVSQQVKSLIICFW